MVLDAIFQGTFSVESFSRPKNPEYKEITKKIEIQIDKIKQTLGPENSHLLDELLNQVYASQYMEAEACFRGGFAAGMELQKEAALELESLLQENRENE